MKRYRVMIEVDSNLERKPFAAETLAKITNLKWNVVYLSSEQVTTEEIVNIDFRNQPAY